MANIKVTNSQINKLVKLIDAQKDKKIGDYRLIELLQSAKTKAVKRAKKPEAKTPKVDL